MIAAAFLISALALPVPSVHHAGTNNRDTAESFFKEYQWIHDLLERMYPNHDFMIIPDRLHQQPPPGWIEVPFFWRSHYIYRREKRSV